jgi:hypothetical protein
MTTLLLVPPADGPGPHNGSCASAPGVRCQTPIVRYGTNASTLCEPCQARLADWKTEQRELRRALADAFK